MPAAVRPAIDALWRLDVALGAVLATGRDPLVSRIRLAWWREALERLDTQAPPAEPLLQAIAAYILPRGVSGAELAAMEEGWAELLCAGPLEAEGLDVYGVARGGRLFTLSARLLGGEGVAADAGARWALVDLARRSSSSEEALAALERARRIALRANLKGKLVPLGMIALLANRDMESAPEAWERQGSPARMARLLLFRLLGR